ICSDPMNTERYIAGRMIRGAGENRYSRPVIRIAIIGIVLGMAVMILSVGIVTGFRTEIRDKMIGFGSHIRIGSFASQEDKGSDPIKIDQSFYPHLDTVDGVRHIQRFAYKPGLIQTDKHIQGIVIKGIGPDHDNAFFRNKLQVGSIPDPSGERSNGILISRFIADRLKLEVGEELFVYLIQGSDDLRPRKFNVQGIYKSGLRKFDKKFLIADIDHIRNVEGWGLEGQIKVKDTCIRGQGVEVNALAFDGDPPYRYEWSDPAWGNDPGPHRFCIKGDTSLRLILKDEEGTLPDTSILSFHPKGPIEGECACKDALKIDRSHQEGTGKYYTGGFEVLLQDFSDLGKMNRIIYKNIPPRFKTTTILQKNKEIFSWLEMLDINVLIVIVLMIGVAAINMTSALLVLILERTRSIGILKAMGATDRSVGTIFLYHAAYLIGIGMIGGDILGIGLGYLQEATGLITLSEENYYVSEVPVLFRFWHLLSLNIGTFLLCCLVLILPSWFVTRIRPVRVIRFE
ncbi:MAG: FtsX-like permease family protein, partial [Flavobacteriales bacterium]